MNHNLFPFGIILFDISLGNKSWLNILSDILQETWSNWKLAFKKARVWGWVFGKGWYYYL